LLPIAGLLTAIALRRSTGSIPTDAFRQGIWIVVAVALFAATLFFLRARLPPPRDLQVPLGVSAIALLLLPILPLLASP